MIKVYGTMECGDCVACKATFDRLGVEYEFIDILGGLYDIKSFLRLRDRHEEFEDPKKYGYIGIPTLVFEDGSLTLDWQGYLATGGFETTKMPQKTSCGIDGRGC